MTPPPTISVVVPVMNEEPNIRPLVDAVRSALDRSERSRGWELILVDDGSSDGTSTEVRSCAREDPRIRLVRLARNYGQTSAMQAGFDHAAGQVVVSMDGDLQNDPADIPALLAKIDEGFDLVAGYRLKRQDALLSRKVPSWAANRMIRWVTGVSIRDNGCSLKAYRRELIERMSLYSDLHRFIPAVAAATAGARIAEVGVRHHARQQGRSKYGISRVLKVLGDLLTIKMIRSFRERPLRLFGTGAAISAVVSAAFAAAAVYSLLAFRASKAAALILPGAAGLWLALSCYLIMLGLIAEEALRTARMESPELGPIAHHD